MIPVCGRTSRRPCSSGGGRPIRAPADQTFLQPFVSYTFPDAVTILANTETTYDWEREVWTVPVALGVSKVFRFGKLPVSLALLSRYWVEGPESAPEWGLRVVATFLFPK